MIPIEPESASRHHFEAVGPPAVALHSIRLDVAGDAADTLASLLTQDESARAARLRSETIARRFRVARGSLRQVLAGYLHLPPHAIRFCTTAAGKPELITSLNPHNLRFSLSHSHEIAVIAVCFGYPVGVDVEHIRPIGNLQDIANRYFLPEESLLLQTCDEWNRPATFFRMWTSKESYLKAAGIGLSGLKGAGRNQMDILESRHFAPAPEYIGCYTCMYP
ncbi:4'-phosphopantetheinyl transferase superfamily protein [bacterium]|nr:4'-phosphopantetheinyl transferase superfamily protein [candidate division CSSED10-310 bacterium]